MKTSPRNWFAWSRAVALSALVSVGCVALAGTAGTISLRFIGEQRVPAKFDFHGTPVGGLSGIDYAAASDHWIAISDDRSNQAPARAYTLRLDYDAHSFTAVAVTGVILLHESDGELYPNRTQLATHEGEVPDLEAIRFDPRDASFWYTSEGDRGLKMNPFVRHATPNGAVTATLPLPEMFHFHPDEELGPRSNLTFEGLAFAADGATLWVAMEAPLYEDGGPPIASAGATVRITHYERSGRVLAQFGYPVDPTPAPLSAGRSVDNGVSEILTTADGQLLVLERSGEQDEAGQFRFHIRLYEADLQNATDVSGLASLRGQSYRPMRKRLLLDFDQLGLKQVDNLEGMAWGPRLANGNPSLVFVSDDNFSASQVTQFLAFEVGSAESKPHAWDEPFAGVVHDSTRIAGFVGEYRWLSNYFECPVSYEGRAYGSTEAAYHASKYPASERDEFTRLDPDAAKKLSRKKGVNQPWWDERKTRVMREIVWAKFSQNSELAAKLLATGDRQLEEANWWGDKFWGTVNGEGQNTLGQLLMETRARLRGGDAKQP